MRRRILLTIVAVAALAVAAFFVRRRWRCAAGSSAATCSSCSGKRPSWPAGIPPSGAIDVTAIESAIERGARSGGVRPGRPARGRAGAGDRRPDRRGPARVASSPRATSTATSSRPCRCAPGPDGPELVVADPRTPLGEPRRLVGSVALLGLAAVAVVAVAGVVGALLARRLSRPVEELGRVGGSSGARRPPPPVIGHRRARRAERLADAGRRADRRAAAAGAVVLVARRPPTAHARRRDAGRGGGRAGRAASGCHGCAPREPGRARPPGVDDHQPARAGPPRRPRAGVVRCRRLVRAQVERWEAELRRRRAGAVDGRRGRVGRVDPAAVRHIVDVLLDNALHHGQGRVEVAARRAGQHIQIDVADEGTRQSTGGPVLGAAGAASHGIGLRLARTLAESEGGAPPAARPPTTVFRLNPPGRA